MTASEFFRNIECPYIKNMISKNQYDLIKKHISNRHWGQAFSVFDDIKVSFYFSELSTGELKYINFLLPAYSLNFIKQYYEIYKDFLLDLNENGYDVLNSLQIKKFNINLKKSQLKKDFAK